MKKIIFLAVVFFLTSIKADALTEKFYSGERISNVYIKMVSGEKVGLDATRVITRSDGDYVYCIDPFSYANYNDEYTMYDYNDSYFNITDEEINKINLIAYYGYNYENHNELKWYAVTQILIWKSLGIDSYFTDSAYNKISLYEDEMNELNNLVYDYYKLPSFSLDTIKYTIDNSYELLDLNEALNYYEIESSNIEAEINNNTLYVMTSNPGIYQISFKRKNDVENNTLLYKLEDSQSLIYPGEIEPIRFKLNIEVIDGSIEIVKIDSEGKNRNFATLSGASYGIYNSDDILIKEVYTNENGIAKVSNLQLGEYTIKELSPSKGYTLDDNIYKIELTFDNSNIRVISKEPVIKGNVKLTKYYGFKDNYHLENDASFEIYDIYDNFIGTYNSQDGVVGIVLDYGEYYIIQQNGIDGYSKIDRFDISIEENKEYNFDLYDEPLIVRVPDTGVTQTKYIKNYIYIIFWGILLIFVAVLNKVIFKIKNKLC